MSIFKKRAKKPEPEAPKPPTDYAVPYNSTRSYAGTQYDGYNHSVAAFESEAAALVYAETCARNSVGSEYVVVRVTRRVKAAMPPVTVTDVATCRSLP